jgi:hypothetical protein
MSKCIEVFHITPGRNVPSILRGGVDPAYHRGYWRVCWFVSARLRPWAVGHVARRHRCHVSEVVILRVVVERSRLVRRRRRGQWTCDPIIDPADIVSVAPWALAVA